MTEEQKERKREYNKKYVKENIEKVRERRRKYYEENIEKHKEYRKKWRQENAEKIKQQQKEWEKNNYEKNREWRNNYERERFKNEPEFKIKKNLRTRIKNSIKRGTKSAPTMDLIGCTIEELKIHLSNQFQEGMTFENYGEWHIDHIRPCASFNLLLEEEQKICFHYTNLQPLWAIDNFKKGSKW